MDKKLAEEIGITALQIGAKLDAQLRKVMENSQEDDFKKYQKATGNVLAALLTEIMNPLYSEFPELKPKQMGGSYEVDPGIYNE